MILLNNQLDAQFFYIFISIVYMFRAAMCPSSEELLYQYDMWYMSLCVNMHTRPSFTQSDINQVSH